MYRIGTVLGWTLLVAACTASPASPTPTTATAVATPTASPTAPLPAATVAPTITPTATPELEPSATPGCPTDSPISPLELAETDAAACFGSADIQVRGWLDGPPSIGYEPPEIKPGWMYYPAPGAPTIWEQQPAGQDDCFVGERQCAWFFPHIKPTSGLTIDGPPRWLLLTGHYDDPAAVRCHWVYPDDTPLRDRVAKDADAVALCRGGFVVDSFVDAP